MGRSFQWCVLFMRRSSSCGFVDRYFTYCLLLGPHMYTADHSSQSSSPLPTPHSSNTDSPHSFFAFKLFLFHFTVLLYIFCLVSYFVLLWFQVIRITRLLKIALSRVQHDLFSKIPERVDSATLTLSFSWKENPKVFHSVSSKYVENVIL